mmetsp:Transcript_60679/g.140095  ORF Transcript_60679/g.140095 Transcript_60679/m.140095 type:complete len:818 (-) Transcript_60679:30-2483(-)
MGGAGLLCGEDLHHLLGHRNPVLQHRHCGGAGHLSSLKRAIACQRAALRSRTTRVRARAPLTRSPGAPVTATALLAQRRLRGSGGAQGLCERRGDGCPLVRQATRSADRSGVIGLVRQKDSDLASHRGLTGRHHLRPDGRRPGQRQIPPNIRQHPLLPVQLQHHRRRCRHREGQRRVLRRRRLQRRYQVRHKGRRRPRLVHVPGRQGEGQVAVRGVGAEVGLRHGEHVPGHVPHTGGGDGHGGDGVSGYGDFCDGALPAAAGERDLGPVLPGARGVRWLQAAEHVQDVRILAQQHRSADIRIGQRDLQILRRPCDKGLIHRQNVVHHIPRPNTYHHDGVQPPRGGARDRHSRAPATAAPDAGGGPRGEHAVDDRVGKRRSDAGLQARASDQRLPHEISGRQGDHQVAVGRGARRSGELRRRHAELVPRAVPAARGGHRHAVHHPAAVHVGQQHRARPAGAAAALETRHRQVAMVRVRRRGGLGRRGQRPRDHQRCPGVRAGDRGGDAVPVPIRHGIRGVVHQPRGEGVGGGGAGDRGDGGGVEPHFEGQVRVPRSRSQESHQLLRWRVDLRPSDHLRGAIQHGIGGTLSRLRLRRNPGNADLSAIVKFVGLIGGHISVSERDLLHLEGRQAACGGGGGREHAGPGEAGLGVHAAEQLVANLNRSRSLIIRHGEGQGSIPWRRLCHGHQPRPRRGLIRSNRTHFQPDPRDKASRRPEARDHLCLCDRNPLLQSEHLIPVLASDRSGPGSVATHGRGPGVVDALGPGSDGPPTPVVRVALRLRRRPRRLITLGLVARRAPHRSGTRATPARGGTRAPGT